MPRSRHPLQYPINRLFLHVGMALQTWIRQLPRAASAEDRAGVEAQVAEALSLPQAVALGLIKRYRIRWGDNDRIRTIDLIPTPEHRKQPGIARLKRLFF